MFQQFHKTCFPFEEFDSIYYKSKAEKQIKAKVKEINHLKMLGTLCSSGSSVTKPNQQVKIIGGHHSVLAEYYDFDYKHFHKDRKSQ